MSNNVSISSRAVLTSPRHPNAVGFWELGFRRSSALWHHTLRTSRRRFCGTSWTSIVKKDSAISTPESACFVPKFCKFFAFFSPKLAPNPVLLGPESNRDHTYGPPVNHYFNLNLFSRHILLYCCTKPANIAFPYLTESMQPLSWAVGPYESWYLLTYTCFSKHKHI
jgi:hypothetical protein